MYITALRLLSPHQSLDDAKNTISASLICLLEKNIMENDVELKQTSIDKEILMR